MKSAERERRRYHRAREGTVILPVIEVSAAAQKRFGFFEMPTAEKKRELKLLVERFLEGELEAKINQNLRKREGDQAPSEPDGS